MPKSSRRKKNSGEKIRKKVVESPIAKKSLIDRIQQIFLFLLNFLKTNYKKWYFILFTIFSIASFFPTIGYFKQLFKSEHQKFKEERYISGILIPEYIIRPNGYCILKCGGNEVSYPIINLISGVNIPLSFSDSSNKDLFNITLKISNNKLLVSAIFKDLEHDEVVGKLIDNQWDFVKDKMLDYHSDDKNIEVIDNTNNVIFRLSFIPPNTLLYSGYNVGLYHVVVFADTAYSVGRDNPNYKLKILKDLQYLKPMFKYN